MKNYYFTFGANHLDREGNSLRDAYCVINAITEDKAREKMFALRGPKWSFEYTWEKFRPQIKKYNLYKINLYKI